MSATSDSSASSAAASSTSTSSESKNVNTSSSSSSSSTDSVLQSASVAVPIALERKTILLKEKLGLLKAKMEQGTSSSSTTTSLPPNLMHFYRGEELVGERKAVGRGGFGEVFTIQVGGKEAVIKRSLIASSEAKEKKSTERDKLLREAAIMDELKDSPYITKVYGFCSDPEEFGIVMEKADAKWATLKRKIESEYNDLPKTADERDEENVDPYYGSFHHPERFHLAKAKRNAFNRDQQEVCQERVGIIVK